MITFVGMEGELITLNDFASMEEEDKLNEQSETQTEDKESE